MEGGRLEVQVSVVKVFCRFLFTPSSLLLLSRNFCSEKKGRCLICPTNLSIPTNATVQMIGNFDDHTRRKIGFLDEVDRGKVSSRTFVFRPPPAAISLHTYGGR